MKNHTEDNIMPLIYSEIGLDARGGGKNLLSILSSMRDEIAALRAEVGALREQLMPTPVQGTETLPIPEETWCALEEEGIVNEAHMPTCSRTEAAVLAHVLGLRYNIEGWAPFERVWRIPRLRNHWQRALAARKTKELLHRYGNIIGR